MSEQLTEAAFAAQLNTKFRVSLGEGRDVELELVEIEGDRGGRGREMGVERFAVRFDGPADLFLPQATYRLEHEQLGAHDIFLVPIAQHEHGFRYQADFNRLLK